MKIGIFDSGVGGKSFILAVQKRFPEAEIVYKEDVENLPYGDKTPEQLFSLTLPIFQQFEAEKCDAVLVACNTVTTTIINRLRESVSLPLVGVEPMIKPAANMTRTNVIAVCATPATLASKRYSYLKQEYASKVRVIEPDCKNWAAMIEQNRSNELQLAELMIDLKNRSVDIIVLGCTHYHWIESELKDLAGEDMQVIQPIEPVLNQLERILKENIIN